MVHTEKATGKRTHTQQLCFVWAESEFTHDRGKEQRLSIQYRPFHVEKYENQKDMGRLEWTENFLEREMVLISAGWRLIFRKSMNKQPNE